ncbi:COG4223 family protein [Yoonia sp. 208BN28-4]|uniref:COG4223 family protein n=1 Tax=Yoonia sp. 208BN28-4 TaxID=3126505 RepID=UPI0030B44D1E
MAKRTKKSQNKASDDIKDAEVTSETPPESSAEVLPEQDKVKIVDETVKPAEPKKPADDASEGSAKQVVAGQDKVKVVDTPDTSDEPATADSTSDDTVEMASVPDPVMDKSGTTASEPAPEPARAAPVVAPVPTQPNRENNVLLPMILGGLIAGGIGYGVAYMQRPVVDMPLEDRVAAQQADIEALQAVVAEPVEMPDMTPLNEQIATLSAETTNQFDALTGQIDALDERVAAVEKQPSADGTLQDTAVAAFQRELDELRAQTEQMSADAAAALQATRDEAAAIEQNAIDNARAATARAAIARVEAALQSGAPFGDVLPDLADAVDMPIPEGLTEAADGIPTLGQLQADFPAAARAALSTARAEGADGSESGGLTGFLQSQLNVRSVTPQEGTSVDAVLSRAEAALKDGNLNETMVEVTALPAVVRGTLSDWIARAETRIAAMQAVDTLSQSINDN